MSVRSNGIGAKPSELGARIKLAAQTVTDRVIHGAVPSIDSVIQLNATPKLAIGKNGWRVKVNHIPEIAFENIDKILNLII